MAHLDDSRERRPSAAPAAPLIGATGELRRVEGIPPAPQFVRERVAAVLLALAGLAAWELAARAGMISALLFPPPSQVALALERGFAEGDWLVHLTSTLKRVFIGFAFGGSAGLIAGLLMGWSPSLRALVDPFVATLHPMPKISLLPLFMVVFGLGEASKVVVVAAGVFFPMLINAMAAVRHIHPVCFEAAEAYGARRIQTFTEVVLPGSLPLLLTGARLAINVGLLLTISIELVAAREGLGRLIWLAWQTMRTEELYGALLLIAGIGMGFNFLIAMLMRRLAPWHVEAS